MTNLVDIKDISPNQATINHCEKMLEHAKQGKLRSVFVVTAWDDDSVTHCWSMDSRNGRRRMIGGIELAKFDFLTDTAGSDRDFRLSEMLNGEG